MSSDGNTTNAPYSHLQPCPRPIYPIADAVPRSTYEAVLALYNPREPINNYLFGLSGSLHNLKCYPYRKIYSKEMMWSTGCSWVVDKAHIIWLWILGDITYYCC